jgi:hypothetical protein
VKPYPDTLVALAAIAACFAAPVAAASPSADEIAVTVGQNGDVITINARLCVPVSVQEAWEVLTDFEHMAQIVSNLESSQVLSRSGNKVVVSQRGRATRGPLSFSFDTVREVELQPYSLIRARLLSGSLKRLEGATRLSSQDAQTRIVNRGEFVADAWVPPVLGIHFIEVETRKQYQEMRDEMLRRHRLHTTSGPSDAALDAIPARACDGDSN